MQFLYITAAAFAAGILGGMGMGGGTIMIPILTILLGIEQHVAQLANLVAFVPMAVITIIKYRQKGILPKFKSIAYIVLPALIASIVGGIMAVITPSKLLKRAFGIFLICLALAKLFSMAERR